MTEETKLHLGWCPDSSMPSTERKPTMPKRNEMDTNKSTAEIIKTLGWCTARLEWTRDTVDIRTELCKVIERLKAENDMDNHLNPRKCPYCGDAAVADRERLEMERDAIIRERDEVQDDLDERTEVIVRLMHYFCDAVGKPISPSSDLGMSIPDVAWDLYREEIAKAEEDEG